MEAKVTPRVPRIVAISALPGAGRGQGADQGDAGNGVGPGHQRCVQGGGDLTDQLKAQEYGQDQDKCQVNGFH